MNYILNLIIWTLAFYGAIEIAKNIAKIIFETKKQGKDTYIIIAVKDGEDYIEGLLRSAVFNLLYDDEDYIKQILVVDLNSKDETKSIVKKLEFENGYVRLVDWEECKDLMNSKV